MGMVNIRMVHVFGLLVLGWIAGTLALRDVQLIAPSAVKLGDTVLLSCKWTLEGNETLYSVKWYRGRQEFFSYLPKEFPFTRIFAQPGIDVDVSRSTSQQVVLRDATRALAGRYRCEVSADAPSFHTQVLSAYIHVVELPPEKPTIKAEKGWYASGDSLRAQCSSPPADPPANLTWLLNGRDIQGKPVIQQRILPSPMVSLDLPGPLGRSTPFPGDENSNIIFSPWKAFGPFVDTIQEGELLPSQDTVVLPSPRHHDSMDEDATDPMPTAQTSNKVASISQLSFMVRPDSFERGQLRLTCISSVHSVYSEQAELVINEERPQIASVLGTRDAAVLPLSVTLFANRSWVAGRMMCRVFPTINYFLATVSLLSIVSITVNRYVMVVYPIYYPRLFQTRNLIIMIIFIWVFSFCMMIPTLTESWGRFSLDMKAQTCTIIPDRNENSPKIFLIAAGFVIPTIFMIACYTRIMFIVQRSRSKSHSRPKTISTSDLNKYYVTKDTSSNMQDDSTQNEQPKEANNATLKRIKNTFRFQRRRLSNGPTRKDKRLHTMIAVVMLSFFTSHAPIVVAKIASKDLSVSPYGTMLGNLVLYLTVCSNPIIYVVMSKDYRKAYKSIFR